LRQGVKLLAESDKCDVKVNTDAKDSCLATSDKCDTNDNADAKEVCYQLLIPLIATPKDKVNVKVSDLTQIR